MRLSAGQTTLVGNWTQALGGQVKGRQVLLRYRRLRSCLRVWDDG